MSKKLDERKAREMLGYRSSFGTYDLNLLSREEKNLSGEELTKEIQDPETRSLLEERRLQARLDGKKAGRPRGENSQNETRMTFIIDKTQLSKIKEIAYQEGVFVKDILFASLEMFIGNYEEENGEVIPKGRSIVK